jgi:hypothetical protein
MTIYTNGGLKVEEHESGNIKIQNIDQHKSLYLSKQELREINQKVFGE